MKRNVLIVGSGGREHALAWKLSQSPLAANIFVAPGNGGTSSLNLPITSTDVNGLSKFAKEHNCLTVVGPEAPLGAGLVDEFERMGLKVFGPRKEQALLETSKVYSKNFMAKNMIPTADFKVFSNPKEAINYAHSKQGRIVVKADGLASGKGVFVCSNTMEAETAINSIMLDKLFGNAGDSVVIEERLAGREVSLMAICDGRGALPFGSAVDHKGLLEGNRGPNTGGMGAYSPADDFEEENLEKIMNDIVRPVVSKTAFKGFLYTGLMLTEEGPKVLEFNARLGDPEAEVILPRLESDLLLLLESLFDGVNLDSLAPLTWSPLHACGIVMCSEGYPRSVRTGLEIRGIKKNDIDSKVMAFHAGTRLENRKLITSSGRVICVTTLGRTLEEASEKAYHYLEQISWQGEFHRQDIGRKPNPTILR